jgi:GNAT superfamily N-acetyltransferase
MLGVLFGLGFCRRVSYPLGPAARHATAMAPPPPAGLTLSPIGTDPATVDAVLSLFAVSLGQGLYRPEGMAEMDAYEGALGLAAWVDGQFAGAAVTQALEPVDAGWYDVFGPHATARLAGHRFTSLEALAVVPAHRGHGIGTAMTEHNMAWGRAMGGDLAVAVSWLGQPDNPSWPLFERLGFDAVAESGEVYTRDSIENGWSCPVCGNPCICRGRLYVRALTA